MKQGLTVQKQVLLPLIYDGIEFENGIRLDVLVENHVVCELKAIESIQSLHRAQLLTYLKLSGHRLGYLINFNVPVIKQGIHRLVL